MKKTVIDETQALQKLFQSALKRADSMDGDAQYYLANAYIFGWGVYIDLQKGWRYCELAAKNGSKYAMSVMLWHYLDVGNLEEAENCIQRRIEAGATFLSWSTTIPDAIKAEGCNIPAIFEKFKKGEEDGLYEFVHMAICYIYGLGVNRDFNEAFSLLKTYLKTMKDDKEAIQYQAIIATMTEIDNAEKIFRKVSNYAEIMSCADPTSTMRCVIKGASYGIKESVREVGFMFYTGIDAYSNKIMKDDSEAVKWLGLAGQLGDEDCMMLEANCFGDIECLVYNLEMAKIKNKSMMDSSNLTIRGAGILGLAGNYQQEGNYKMEFDVLYPYAKEGNLISQVEIGRLLYLGKGITENKEEAIYWWKLAAQKGNEEAIEYLKTVEELQKEQNNQISITTQSSGGCYVATDIYGSYDCPEVWTLRRFRDYKLANNIFGRIFIQIYYTISPQIVKYFGCMKLFHNFGRVILNKLVRHLNAVGYENTPYNDKI